MFSKWGRIELGLPVTISSGELASVTLRDFMDISKDTGLKIEVKRLRRGFYKLIVKS